MIFDSGYELLKKELLTSKQPLRLIGIGVASLMRERQLHMLDMSDIRMEKLNLVIDRIRKKHGFTAIQTGRTFLLREIFPNDDEGYTLATPSLSR